MGAVRLGRVEFEWPLDDIPELLGGAVEASGLRAVAGEPALRSQNLALPVRGPGNDATAGERLRRQVRALLNNEPVRSEGLYFRFDDDPEASGWLVCGGGDLSDEDAGITFGEWKLELRDAYRVGNMRTHWDARRLSAADRRLATTPRDYLERLYSTDFDTAPALAVHHIPVGAGYVTGSSGVGGLVAGGELDGRPDGETVSFYLPESERDVRDALIFDTRGNDAPVWTAAGDDDPQAVYGWEEVYGTDYPLTTEDADGWQPTVPVLANGLCRVRWIANPDPGLSGEYGLVLEQRDDEGDLYAPHGYVTLWVDAGSPVGYPDAVRVAEWTPERAVLALWFQNRSVVAYVTVQRGWRGPRIELYNQEGQIARMRVKVAEAGAVTLGTSSGTAVVGSGTDYGDFTTREPWLYLKPPTAPVLTVAVLQERVELTGRTGNGGVDLEVPAAPPFPDTGYPHYLSVTFGKAAQAGALAGAQRLGQSNLIDARATPDLVTV